MNALKAAEDSIKQLTKEVVALDVQQTELVRKKWALEDKIRNQEYVIALLSVNIEEKKKSLSVWKRVAILLAASWALVLSFFNIDRK